MKSRVIRWFLVVVLAGAVASPALFAIEDSSKTLPTLLIKGEVVSLDTTDPAATLLKVKDRYGFETPIYLTKETKIAKGDQALTAADLTQGEAVEVEYNFDINTAKRHAVTVKASVPAAVQAAPAAQAPGAAEVAASAPAPASTASVTAPAAPVASVAAQPAGSVPTAAQPAAAQPATAPAAAVQPATPSRPSAAAAAVTNEPKKTAPAGQTTP